MIHSSTMKSLQKLQQMTLVIGLATLFLYGCTPQAPIPIIITPTAQPSPTTGAIDISDVTPIPPTVSSSIVLPTVNPNNIPTRDPQTVSATPLEVASANEATPSDDFIGAIIDENYVLPPTDTPRPTRTPLPPPTQNVPANISGAEVAAAPAASVTAAPANITGRLDRSQMGIQLYYNMPGDGWQAVMAQTHQMRVDWVKLQVNWAFMQPDAPGQYGENFRLFEQHVETAHNNGYKVLLSIAKAPNWARNVNRNEDGPPDDPQQLAQFIGFMLSQFGESVDAIEVWNEPNLIREWTGALPFNGEGYMQLFRPAYDRIRAYSPDIVIIAAGLAPTGTTAGVSVDDRTYLQQMYDAGLANYQDVVVGIHPYGWGNSPDARCCNSVSGRGWDDDPHFFFLDNIEDYREIMLRNNHDVQLWTTEFGWATWAEYPTDPPQPWMSYNSPEAQRDYTMRAFEIGQSREYMGPMILWNLNFGNEFLINNRVELAGYSLLYPGFGTGSTLQERPLYWALVYRP